jgi:hypothetical protein
MMIQSITIYQLPITNYHGASGIISTTVEDSLQIDPFYAKRTQFPKKSNERNRFTNKGLWRIGHLVKWEKRTQNEPKFKKAKMNVTYIITKDYENISNWAICENEPNTKPTCRGVASGEDGSKAKNAALQLFTVGSRLKIILAMYPIIW